MSIDYTSPPGQVRLLTADVDEANLLLTDVAIEGLLAMNGQDVRLAAADALDTIATSETLVSKVIRTQDLATNGPSVAADLRARAKALRDQVADSDAEDLFDVVDTLAPTCRPELTERPYTVWGL